MARDRRPINAAGSFGYEAEHYDVSRKIGAERLFPEVESQPREAVIAVARVSCREQIGHFTGRRPIHIAEVLATGIATATSGQPETMAADD